VTGDSVLPLGAECTIDTQSDAAGGDLCLFSWWPLIWKSLGMKTVGEWDMVRFNSQKFLESCWVRESNIKQQRLVVMSVHSQRFVTDYRIKQKCCSASCCIIW